MHLYVLVQWGPRLHKYRGWTTYWKHCRDCTYLCINMVLDHLLPTVQLQSLEWTRTSFEQFVAEFCTILLEEHLQVASNMLEVGIFSSP
jgi:hypothetical protein